MLRLLGSPFIAFFISIYSVAIFGEFIQENGMIIEEFLLIWGLILLYIVVLFLQRIAR